MWAYYIWGMHHDFVYSQFLWGCLVSLLFLVGKQSLCVAFAEGPGGPVNAIVITQSLYQVILDIAIEHQVLGKWGIMGFCLGIVGTLIIAVGNMVIRKCIKKETYENSPLKRFL